MEQANNEVDTSQTEIDRDLSQGMDEFGINLDANFNSEEPGPVPGANTTPEPDPAVMEAKFNELMVKGLSACFTFINDKAVPGYNIQPEENMVLAQSWADVVNHYFPDIKFGPLMTAFAMTGLVYGERAANGVPAKLKEVNEKDTPDDPLNSADNVVFEDG